MNILDLVICLCFKKYLLVELPISFHKIYFVLLFAAVASQLDAHRECTFIYSVHILRCIRFYLNFNNERFDIHVLKIWSMPNSQLLFNTPYFYIFPVMIPVED